MSSDPNFFQAPSAYPQPPKDMYYQVPATPPAGEQPKPIFPWEEHRSKPARHLNQASHPHPSQPTKIPLVHRRQRRKTRPNPLPLTRTPTPGTTCRRSSTTSAPSSSTVAARSKSSSTPPRPPSRSSLPTPPPRPPQRNDDRA